MTRAPDWPSRLSAWVQSVENTARFDWKSFNCGFMVADSAIAMGLPDPYARYRGKTAAKLKHISATRLLETVPFEEVPVAKARRGDWLAYSGTGGGPQALAVCLGKQALGFDADTGKLVRVETINADTAFRVR